MPRPQLALEARFLFKHLDPLQQRWSEIDRYNAGIAGRLPAGARELAFAEWQYDASDPRCPHDSSVQSMEIGADESRTQVRGVRLSSLGAYHDRMIHFDYANVAELSIEGEIVQRGGRRLDWLYDEIHLLDSGLVVHLIEFDGCIICIECSDFSFSQSLLDDQSTCALSPDE
jgi:hypothetical protein